MSDDVWQVVDEGCASLAVRVLKGSTVLRTVRLDPAVTYIGRMPENHVVLDDAKASRSHARILFVDGSAVLEDQQSENGTLVNGRAAERKALSLGDLITIGGHTLELVKAEQSDLSAARQERIEVEEAEWRTDRTLSINTGDIQRRLAASVVTKKATPEKKPPPEIEILLRLAGREVRKKAVFKAGRKRRPEDPKEDMLEIRLITGSWVLVEKVKLA